MGKGRTIAGLIHENFLQGRKKAVWVSVSNDLKYDSERDLKDIGAKSITVHSLSKVCPTLSVTRLRSNHYFLKDPLH